MRVVTALNHISLFALVTFFVLFDLVAFGFMEFNLNARLLTVLISLILAWTFEVCMNKKLALYLYDVVGIGVGIAITMIWS